MAPPELPAPGYIALLLHAHLPFVRHPEHEQFLEESWFHEALTETYIPLLQLLERWEEDGLPARVSLTLSPTLCAMLSDALLQQRYIRKLELLIELAERETQRTRWEPALAAVASFYLTRFKEIHAFYVTRKGDLLSAFGHLQHRGRLQIITTAATHAVLPLIAQHPPSLRAQILLASHDYQRRFGRPASGFWLPECAYADGIAEVLRLAGVTWTVLETHGILQSHPQPRYGVFAPVVTGNGLAAFGRDADSARQVWSRDQGYPGDSRYREFYRDAGFDLEFDYVKKYFPGPDQRGFTGIKYYRITDRSPKKQVYQPALARAAAAEHAQHFLDARVKQCASLKGLLAQPPILVCPFDAELFGHWWYEGLDFLDSLIRKVCSLEQGPQLITPEDYLRRHSRLQLSEPATSSWGEAGYFQVWLNETNEWLYPHLSIAQERMTELAMRNEHPNSLHERALKQAGRELLLAQASDWPFILRTGTSPEYARRRLTTHLDRFNTLYQQLCSGKIDPGQLKQMEAQDNLFPEMDFRYWRLADSRDSQTDAIHDPKIQTQ